MKNTRPLLFTLFISLFFSTSILAQPIVSQFITGPSSATVSPSSPTNRITYNLGYSSTPGPIGYVVSCTNCRMFTGFGSAIPLNAGQTNPTIEIDVLSTNTFVQGIFGVNKSVVFPGGGIRMIEGITGKIRMEFTQSGQQTITFTVKGDIPQFNRTITKTVNVSGGGPSLPPCNSIGEYQVNGGSFTSLSGSVNVVGPGTITLRMPSGPSYGYQVVGGNASLSPFGTGSRFCNVNIGSGNFVIVRILRNGSTCRTVYFYQNGGFRLGDQQDAVSLYPNPFKDNLIAEWSSIPTGANTSFEIIDLLGKVVKKGELTQITKLNLTQLGPGVYFFKTGEQLHKIVKQ